MGPDTESESAVRNVPHEESVSGVRTPERTARDMGRDDAEAKEGDPLKEDTAVGFESITTQTIEVILVGSRELVTKIPLFQLTTLDGVILATFEGDRADDADVVAALIGEMVEGGNPWPLS